MIFINCCNLIIRLLRINQSRTNKRTNEPLELTVHFVNRGCLHAKNSANNRPSPKCCYFWKLSFVFPFDLRTFEVICIDKFRASAFNQFYKNKKFSWCFSLTKRIESLLVVRMKVRISSIHIEWALSKWNSRVCKIFCCGEHISI